MSFSGTQTKCKACDKAVYAAEVISASGVNYHNTCFRCSHCNGRLAVRFYNYFTSLIFHEFLLGNVMVRHDAKIKLSLCDL